MTFNQESRSAPFVLVTVLSVVIVLFCHAVHCKELVPAPVPVPVGGVSGWKLNVDYKAWAHDNPVYVGDVIVFNYVKDAHNVLAVDQTAYNSCNTTSFKKKFETGSDQIDLTAPGPRWYICGVGNHCSKGMKVAINVLSRSAPAPAPWASSPQTGSASELLTGYTALLLGTIWAVILTLLL